MMLLALALLWVSGSLVGYSFGHSAGYDEGAAETEECLKPKRDRHGRFAKRAAE